MHPPKLPLLAVGLALTGFCLTATTTQARPPTIDPTYGFPIPKPSEAKAPSHDASWIWAASTSDNQTVGFRKTFTLSEKPASALLYITADDFFTLYLNGRQVDKTEPVASDPNLWQHVHQVDVAKYLVSGKNVIAITGRNAGGEAGLLARLEISGQPAIATDSTWKQVSAPTSDDWIQPSFDDSGWQAARVEAPLTGNPWANVGGLQGWPGYESGAPYLAHVEQLARSIEELPGDGSVEGAESLTRQHDVNLTIHPAAPDSKNPASILLDFGQEMAGRITVIGTPGAQVQVSTGESRDECLNGPWHGPSRLICAPGDGTATSPYSAFRYARISFFGSGPYKITRIALDNKYYPVEYKGSFDCSDPLLTQIWYTGAYTSHLCMQEDIWDAPKRDRARWIGDLHVSGDVINNVFADKFLMEQTIDRLRDDAQGGRPDTELPRSHVNGIPGYSCAWICTLADFDRHIGDTAYVAKQHDRLIGLMEYLRGELDDRGIFANKYGAWPFVDWAPDFNGDGPMARAATHLFLVKAIREGSYLLGQMGDSAGAAKYNAWADTLTAAARKFLADPVRGTYGDRRQENAMAIYSGVATDAQIEPIYWSVLNPNSPSWNIVASPYYNNYVIYAMGMTGHNQDVLAFLRRYWGGMLAEGATTFWEGYDTSWPKEHYHAHLQADNGTGYFVSLCHGWSCGPTNYLTERVLGVRPLTTGFQTAVIEPDLGDLQWAEGSVPAPSGAIRVRAEKAANGTTALKVTLPPGVIAEVGVVGKGVTLNGKTVAPERVDGGRAYVRLDKRGAYSVGAL